MRLLKIGRDNSCDIVLHSDKVSSLHAEITLLDSGDMLLEDKGSSNGTFIMNQPVKPGKEIPIKRGDAIRFADVELQWSQIPMPEDNSAYNALYGIGKAFRNTIQLSGPTVSRYHATIKKGKNGKMYIIDHSKNGTTVDGNRISSNNPVRIKKKSAIVCGGVPVNLKNSAIQWPNQIWKPILAAVAGLLLLVGVGFGVYKLLSKDNFSDKDLFARYNHSTVMVKGIYHYEVSIGDLDMSRVGSFIPQKVLLAGNVPLDVSSLSQKEFVEKLNEITKEEGLYTGTAFFISPDGKLVTNLHIVKPWLFDNAAEQLRSYYSRMLAQAVANMDARLSLFRNLAGVGSGATDMSAYISQVKVEGVLDYIALVPQGEIFDPDNVIKCRVLSAGDDINKDVALIQTINKQLPTKYCTYINVSDSMDISEEILKVGEHIYTIGFPHGMNPFIQIKDNDKGIQAYSAGGSITSEPTEYGFSFDAASYHGASGSPIFNEKGMLIGVLNSGLDKSQGYNRAIKAKYVKELLDNPYKK